MDQVGRDIEMTVDVTPDGHGDCIRTVVSEVEPKKGAGSVAPNLVASENDDRVTRKERRMFVKPHEQKMTLGEFCRLLRKGKGEQRKKLKDQKERGNRLDNDEQWRVTVNDDEIDRHEKLSTFDENDLEVFPVHHLPNDSDVAKNDVLLPCAREATFRANTPVVYYSRQVSLELTMI